MRTSAIFFLTIATAALILGAPLYRITNLGGLSGAVGAGYTATGINRSGQVAGWAAVSVEGGAQYRAFLYSGGVMTALPFLPGGLSVSQAMAINNNGDIAGWAFDASVNAVAFLYSGGLMTGLGILPSGHESWATALNDSDQVVGWGVNSSGEEQAFLYSGGVMTPLPFLGPLLFPRSRAYGINNSGQVVGFSINSQGGGAFLYTGGQMTPLFFTPNYGDYAYAINNKGEVVGEAYISPNPPMEAFLYSGGKMSGLGYLPGDGVSTALALNNNDQVVGQSYRPTSPNSYVAFLYSGGQMVDLNTLIPPGALPAGVNLFQATGINDSGQIIANGSDGNAYLLSPPEPLQFVPVSPCRIADTRGAAGPFGGPTMAAGSSRSFAVPQSGCGIPSTAQAYSLNVTVVPQGPLSYLTLWPTGLAQPSVSTLNSWGGYVVANAAIVPAGSAGAVSVFATDPTDVIIDVNGYFDSSSGPNAYSFYSATPCRIADTRSPAGALGGPSMSGGQTRDFPVPSSSCGIPSAAIAYSMNVTVVPHQPLGFLTAWPAGQAQPNVSTLNSWTGKVVANAAIVPAGTSGSVSVYVTDPTDVVLDANGYFAPPGSSAALSFYPVVPCRVADTRNPDGPFGGPEMEAGATRSFPIPAGGCSIPSTAAAYSLNITVVPDGPLSYLSSWPTGSPQPFVSTLNSWDGTVVANAAIVPAGSGGAISIYVTNPTQVILDINGYFAP